jgi:hypothetical protein
MQSIEEMIKWDISEVIFRDDFAKLFTPKMILFSKKHLLYFFKKILFEVLWQNRRKIHFFNIFSHECIRVDLNSPLALCARCLQPQMSAILLY